MTRLPTTQLLKSSEAGRIAFLNDYIAAGTPGDNGSVEALVRARRRFLCLCLNGKIEEIEFAVTQELSMPKLRLNKLN